MKRATWARIVGVLVFLFGLVVCNLSLFARPAPTIKWIWFDEDKAAGETRFFRRVLRLDRFVDEASLDITADQRFTVWIDGHEIGKGDNWKRVYAFDVKKYLTEGKHVIAVEATGSKHSSGLMVRVNYVPNGTSKTAM